MAQAALPEFCKRNLQVCRMLVFFRGSQNKTPNIREAVRRSPSILYWSRNPPWHFSPGTSQPQTLPDALKKKHIENLNLTRGRGVAPHATSWNFTAALKDHASPSKAAAPPSLPPPRGRRAPAPTPLCHWLRRRRLEDAQRGPAPGPLA